MKKSHQNSIRKGVRIILFLFLMVLYTPIICGFEFDNVKSITGTGKEGYPNLEIKNAFGFGEVIADLELTKNTKNCSNDCEAVKNITIYKDTKLIDEVYFETVNPDGSRTKQDIRKYEFYIYDKTIENLVDDHSWICNNGKTLPNGTIEQICKWEKTGNHIEYQEVWLPYDYEVMKAGNYILKLRGEKRPDRTVDWIVTSQGIKLLDWEVWGSSSVTYQNHSWGQATDEGATNSAEGMAIIMNKDDTLKKVTLKDGVYPSAMNVSIWINTSYTDATLLNSSLSSNGNATFGMKLLAGKTYFVVVMNTSGGSAVNYHPFWTQEPSACSLNSSSFNITRGLNGDVSSYPTIAYSSASIYTQRCANWRGLSFGEDSNTITANSPNDNYISSGEVIFNCSATTSISRLVNMSLYTNITGNWALTNTTSLTGTSNTTTFKHTISTEGNYKWGCKVFDNDTAFGVTNNRTFTIDKSAPQISIIKPIPIINYGIYRSSEILNWSITEPNLASVWFSYNGTNTTLYALKNQTTFNLSFYLPYSLIFYANDSVGNLNLTHYSWQYKIFNNNVSYNSSALSSSTETFNINVGINDSLFTNVVAYLIYNSTLSLASKTGSGYNTRFYASTTLPLVSTDTIKQFMFNFTLTYSNGSITYVNTSYYNQTVEGLTLKHCGGAWNITFVNFTFEDESSGLAVNGTFKATFHYWKTGASENEKGVYSFNNPDINYSSYEFCVNPAKASVSVDMDAEYGGSIYEDRTYYFDGAVLTNSTTEIKLYQLNTTESIKFYINVLDGTTPFTNAFITISKYFTGEGVYKTIGIRKTDDNGEFVEYLDLDQNYRFAITRDGTSYGTYDRTASCSVAPCEMTLQIETDVTDLWAGFYDIYAGSMQYIFKYNDTSKMASLIFVDTTGLAQYVRLQINEISYDNSTGSLICNTTLYSSSGTISCNMSSYDGDFIAKGYVSRSPELLIGSWTFVINLIKDVLGMEGILIALIIIITIGLVGIWSPTASIVLTSFAILMMKITGFVAFGWTTVILLITLGVILITKIKQ